KADGTKRPTIPIPPWNRGRELPGNPCAERRRRAMLLWRLKSLGSKPALRSLRLFWKPHSARRHTRARNPETSMARHNPRPHPDPTAAEALQAAMRALHRELRAAPPEKAGDL